LSHTQFVLLALDTISGGTWESTTAEDWIRRCQYPEGGFGYVPANSDYCWGKEPFGSTTAAEINSLISLGVDSGNAVLDMAIGSMDENYKVEQNPWHCLDRHYYYLWSLSRALSALENEEQATEAHYDNWRSDITELLLEAQWQDGRWRNEDDAHTEIPPDTLVTAHALNTLFECLERK